jgi:hypothetical protein
MLKIDIDLYDVKTWKDKWNVIYNILKTLRFRAKYYITKHGIHIRIEDLPSSIDLRYYFGDDWRRIEMDIERMRMLIPYDYLFEEKNNFREIEVDVWGLIDYVLRY